MTSIVTMKMGEIIRCVYFPTIIFFTFDEIYRPNEKRCHVQTLISTICNIHSLHFVSGGLSYPRNYSNRKQYVTEKDICMAGIYSE